MCLSNLPPLSASKISCILQFQDMLSIFIFYIEIDNIYNWEITVFISSRLWTNKKQLTLNLLVCKFWMFCLDFDYEIRMIWKAFHMKMLPKGHVKLLVFTQSCFETCTILVYSDFFIVCLILSVRTKPHISKNNFIMKGSPSGSPTLCFANGDQSICYIILSQYVTAILNKLSY